MRVLQFDLSLQCRQMQDELHRVLDEVTGTGHFILGKNVKKLEEEIARYLGVRYGVGVASGSDALFLALLACGVKPGDEVITTAFTFFATAGSIARAGAVPVFVDIDPATYNLDVSQVESKITPQTRAVIPVHLYGQPADMEILMEVACKYGLAVVEDAAQAIGSAYGGRKAGSFGRAGCLSFFPTKNLGGFGDGGMVVTDDPDVAEKVRMLRVHGAGKKYYHECLGYNSRLDELQAAFLRVRFPHLEAWTDARRERAVRYGELFRQKGLDQVVKEPYVAPGCLHVFNQYTVRAPFRDELRAFLAAHGVGTAVYYPIPMHLQPAFAYLNYRRGAFPEVERASAEVISLPLYPELTAQEQECVAGLIKKFYGRISGPAVESVNL